MNVSKGGLVQYPSDVMGAWIVTGLERFLEACAPPEEEEDTRNHWHARQQWEQQRAHDRLKKLNADVFLAHLQRSPGKVVSVYHQEQAYGGPEEGGWWYNTAERVWFKQFRTQRARNKFLRKVVKAWAGHLAWATDMTQSNSEGEDDVQVSREIPAPYYPETRPHYE